jgi:large conductance mechanosensitive channel
MKSTILIKKICLLMQELLDKSYDSLYAIPIEPQISHPHFALLASVHASKEKKTMLSEFRDFINRGNVIDLAVAVIMGAAFGAIVTSLMEDLITPLLLSPALRAAQVEDLAALTANGIKYGEFLAAVLNFIVVAFVMFLLVKAVNHMRRQKADEPAVPAPTNEEKLLGEIRDLLAAQARQS